MLEEMSLSELKSEVPTSSTESSLLPSSKKSAADAVESHENGRFCCATVPEPDAMFIELHH